MKTMSKPTGNIHTNTHSSGGVTSGPMCPTEDADPCRRIAGLLLTRREKFLMRLFDANRIRSMRVHERVKFGGQVIGRGELGAELRVRMQSVMTQK